MGHRKKSAPRRGSLGVRPRKRAARIVPRVRSWPEPPISKPMLLGFMGYKAGMTHAIVIDDRPHTRTSGKEIFIPVTVLETPPMMILGVRAYRYSLAANGLISVGEVWRSPIDGLIKVAEMFADNEFVGLSEKDLVRKYLHGLRKRLPGLVKPSKESGEEYGYKFIEKDWEARLDRLLSGDIRDVRVIATTIPVLTGIGKKAPEILEIRIGGGSIEDRINYAKQILGAPVTIKDVLAETPRSGDEVIWFSVGGYSDVIGVTKGKGFQGVIKRFGVKELPRWHKHRKGSRKIGARSYGSGVMATTPQAGQMGYHRRTDYNKRIVAVGENGLEVTPSGGFPGYGIVRTHYVMLHGTVMGPRKRIIVMRYPIRPPHWIPESAPKIVYLSLSSKQGA